MRLAEDTANRGDWDIGFLGYDYRVNEVAEMAGEFNVDAFLARFHQTDGFKPALDFAKRLRLN